jgi:septation ring formation regulator EzrA
MDYNLIGVIIGAVGGILATWVKMTNEVTKIKSRLYSLEKQETKVQETLDVLVSGINEIKLLLAKKGIE